MGQDAQILNGRYTSAATAAEAGMGKTHAHTTRAATPQRTAERRRTAPTPTMAPVIVCVVLTGIPQWDIARIVTPPPVSAEKPSEPSVDRARSLMETDPGVDDHDEEAEDGAEQGRRSTGDFAVAASAPRTVRPHHSPMNCSTISRRRARLSKSTKTICCQVPSRSFPPAKGTTRDGPSRAARTWE